MSSSPKPEFIVCPWCKTEAVNTQVIQRKIRLQCKKCGMNAFVTKIPDFRTSNEKQKRKIST